MAATAVVLGFFAVDTLRNAPETFVAIVAMTLLAVALDFVWKRVRDRAGRPRTPTSATSAMIVPRWEWRTFGERFGAAEDRLRELAPTRVDDSDELYVVSDRSEGSIKVRDGVLDVKRLEQVSDDGLEQWRPVAKAEFPIAAADVAALLEALDADAPPLARDAYELDELVDEVVGPSPELLAVPVHKRRAHYLVGGCMAELTDVTRGLADDAHDRGRGRGSRARAQRPSRSSGSGRART